MDFVAYQMPKQGVEIKKELLGDQPQLIGDLVTTAAADVRGRPTKVARLQRENGEILLELTEVQIEAFKGPRLVLKGIEHKKTTQGPAEYAQQWLCVQAAAPLPMTSRERFFKESGGGRP